MVYNSEEVKDPSFIILEDDALSKIVFKKSDGSTLVVPLADLGDIEAVKSALSGIYVQSSTITSMFSRSAHSYVAQHGMTSAAIQAAVDDAVADAATWNQEHWHAHVGPGVWDIVEAVKVPTKGHLQMDKAAWLQLADGANSDIITNANWHGDSALTAAWTTGGDEEIEISGGFLHGNRLNQTAVVGDGPAVGSTTSQSLITLVNVARPNVHDVNGTSPFLHGIDFGVRDEAANSLGDPGCIDGQATNCFFEDFGDDGVTTHYSKRIRALGGSMRNAAATYSGSSNGVEWDDGSEDCAAIGTTMINCKSGGMFQGHAGRKPAIRCKYVSCFAIGCDQGYQASQPTTPHATVPAYGAEIIDCSAINCGRAVAVVNYAGVQIINLTPSGISTADVRLDEQVAGTVHSCVIRGGSLSRSTSAQQIQFAGTATISAVTVEGVKGFRTRSSGTGTIPGGTTSTVVSHGLAVTPSAKDITITPTDNLGSAAKIWVTNVGAAQFTVNANVDPVTSANFAWAVDYQPALSFSRVIAKDTFTRADSSVSLGSTEADVNGLYGSFPWTTRSGTPGVILNQAYKAAGSVVVTIDPASVDFAVEDSITAATTRNQGIVFHWVDATNYLLAVLEAGVLKLYKVDAGAFTSLGTYGPGFTAGQVYLMRVVAEGSTIRVSLDGVERITRILTAAEQTKYGAATVIGLWEQSTSGDGRHDNFTVYGR